MIEWLAETVTVASLITGAVLSYRGSRPERGDLLVLQGAAAKKAFRAFRRKQWERRLGPLLVGFGTAVQLWAWVR